MIATFVDSCIAKNPSFPDPTINIVLNTIRLWYTSSSWKILKQIRKKIQLMCEDLHVHEFYAASTEEKQFTFMQTNFKFFLHILQKLWKITKKIAKRKFRTDWKKKKKKTALAERRKFRDKQLYKRFSLNFRLSILLIVLSSIILYLLYHSQFSFSSHYYHYLNLLYWLINFDGTINL